MKSVYVRASMAAVQDGGGGRARNSRRMQSLGYYCFKCEQFWTDDQVYRIVDELLEKRIQQCISLAQRPKSVHDQSFWTIF